VAGPAARSRLAGHQPGTRLRPAAHVRPRRHPTPLGQAFIEYGPIAKTLHLLALVDPIDGTYQRRMNRQLTVQESRHRLGRKICHGNRDRPGRPTAKAKKISSPCSAWSSTPSCYGTPATSTPSSLRPLRDPNPRDGEDDKF